MIPRIFWLVFQLIVCVVLCSGQSVLCAAPVPLRGERIHFMTSDGIRITGIMTPAGRAHTTVILLHGLGSTMREWDAFAEQLAAAGYGVLRYDARGHGESAVKQGRTYSYTGFSGTEWNMMPDDLGKAIDFLATRGISRQRIACAGASLGANVCLAYAAGHVQVPWVVLLSPGLRYAGISTEKSIAAFRFRPVLFVAAPEDRYSFQSCEALRARIAVNPTADFITASHGHGVGMFDGSVDTAVIDWISAQP